MIEFARQNAMPARMTRQKNNVAARNLASQKFIGRSAERRVDLDPFLFGETFDMIKPAAANNANARVCHKFEAAELHRRGKFTRRSRSARLFANLQGGANG